MTSARCSSAFLWVATWAVAICTRSQAAMASVGFPPSVSCTLHLEHPPPLLTTHALLVRPSGIRGHQRILFARATSMLLPIRLAAPRRIMRSTLTPTKRLRMATLTRHKGLLRPILHQEPHKSHRAAGFTVSKVPCPAHPRRDSPRDPTFPPHRPPLPPSPLGGPRPPPQPPGVPPWPPPLSQH
eukprot:RCo050439